MLERNQLVDWCKAHNIHSIYDLINSGKTTVSRQTLYRLNRGQTSPTVDMMLKLNSELGINFIVKDGKVILE